MEPESRRGSSWLPALESNQDPAAARLVVRVSGDLKHLMDEGLLEEFYYALSVVELKVPPLRLGAVMLSSLRSTFVIGSR